MSPLDDVSGLNARVSVLEARWEEHRDWMRRVVESLDRANASLAALRLCSSPNLCATLREEMDGMKDDFKKAIAEMALENKNAMARIASLEKWRTFISGITATLGAIWLVLQVIIPWVVRLKGG